MLDGALIGGRPMAVRTCEGSVAPEEQAAAGGDGESLEVEGDDEGFAFDASRSRCWWCWGRGGRRLR